MQLIKNSPFCFFTILVSKTACYAFSLFMMRTCIHLYNLYYVYLQVLCDTGAQPTTPTFWSTSFGQTVFGGQQVGSRVVPYTSTPKPDNSSSSTNATVGKLESLSAIFVYKDKSHFLLILFFSHLINYIILYMISRLRNY